MSIGKAGILIQVSSTEFEDLILKILD